MDHPFAEAFRYKAWANRELLDCGERQWPSLPEEDARFFVRILNHTRVVDCIFIGHITGKPHGFDADNTTETPTIAELRAAMAQTDGWLVEYAARAGDTELARDIPFVFTDGDHGRMRVDEMLLHLLTHGSNHRGMAARVLATHGLERPRDTFTRFLHLVDPSRRGGTMGPGAA
jgi:uncharacterized damage-inducible protein DinB